MSNPQIDTGDVVQDVTSGEKYRVANCRDGYVIFCGWPHIQIPAADCALVRKATPEERLQVLHELAEFHDSRGAYARNVLAQATD